VEARDDAHEGGREQKSADKQKKGETDTEGGGSKKVLELLQWQLKIGEEERKSEGGTWKGGG